MLNIEDQQRFEEERIRLEGEVAKAQIATGLVLAALFVAAVVYLLIVLL